MKQLPDKLTAKVCAVLEDRGLTGEAVTRETMKQAICDALHDYGVQAHSPPRASPAPQVEQAPQSTGCAVHMWGGKLRLLPQNYELPTVHLGFVWRLWWVGNEAAGVPPLRHVTGHDFGTDRKRKDYSDWKRICESLEWIVKKKCRLSIPAQCTVADVDGMFDAALDELTKGLAEQEAITAKRELRSMRPATFVKRTRSDSTFHE
eukprot:CAMPEP_0177655818 /NCGR_PEP_ID=MMETSP0447-20121125/15192_1 /TAXON_ID=0 /ORGANISM="Stygamoeba regulata, Strain BSH-02190019" /LENGTH=204 /DNA_ID=CAMNT_0019159807 /DNA_START=132 /DNA_END=743 /DNA_ORIENTATION=-